MSLSINKALEEFFQRPCLAALTTLHQDGSPHTSFVWYEWDGGAFLVSTRMHRQKAKNLERDPRISLAVYDPDDVTRWFAASSKAELRSENANALIDRLSRRYDGKSGSRFFADDRVIVRLVPERIIGEGWERP